MAKVMNLRVETGLDNDTLTHHSSAHLEQQDLTVEEPQALQWMTVPPLPGVPSLFAEALRLTEFETLQESLAKASGNSLGIEDLSLVMDGYNSCNCVAGDNGPIEQCPHLQEHNNIAFLRSVKARLEHLEILEKKAAGSKSNPFADDIPILRTTLYERIRTILQKTDCGKDDCHFRQYLLSFCKDLDDMAVPSPAEDLSLLRTCSAGKLCVNLSFGSNILLVILKIIAYSLSLSMSVLASMVDSCLDILSGLVLFICARLARSGAEKTGHQDSLKLQKQSITYPIGKRRYETLGVLSFACIMGTFAATLAYESIQQIIQLAKGVPDNPARFDTLQIVIIGFTIVLKLFLCLFCHFVGRRAKILSDACLAYRDDHRNDVLSNSLGFVAAFVGSKFNGHDGTVNLSYIDPVGSLILCIYILINWTLAARTQIRSMIGRSLGVEDQARLVLHAMHFDPSIERINEVLAYQCGKESTVEVTICLPDQMYVCSCHDIVHGLQDHIQRLDFVERCFVHVESTNCHILANAEV